MRNIPKRLALVLLVLCNLSCNGEAPQSSSEQADESVMDKYAHLGWTRAEVDTLRSLWIRSLPSLPPDPSNSVADNPDAAELGRRIFFDNRFSENSEVSCATCHQAERYFTDGLDRAQGVARTKRGTPTIIGTAYNPWFFWDGRRDSQWAQALGPLENEREHAGTRTQYAHILYQDEVYRTAYQALFGPMPDISDTERFPETAGPVKDRDARDAWKGMTEDDQETITRIFVNTGKAIAAYERRVMPGPSRFDAYVEALLAGDEAAMQEALNEDEVGGLHLFLGKGTCIDCHNGPLLTNNAFHNIGVPIAKGLKKDYGRMHSVYKALSNEFSCRGKYSDAGVDDCSEQRFAKTSGADLIAAFKVPTLRNIAETEPYMRSGQYDTLEEVVSHYNRAPRPVLGHSMLEPLNLTAEEQTQLAAFLHSLTGPVIQ